MNDYMKYGGRKLTCSNSSSASLYRFSASSTFSRSSLRRCASFYKIKIRSDISRLWYWTSATHSVIKDAGRFWWISCTVRCTYFSIFNFVSHLFLQWYFFFLNVSLLLLSDVQPAKNTRPITNNNATIHNMTYRNGYISWNISDNKIEHNLRLSIPCHSL